jgi:hypothetical protein
MGYINTPPPPPSSSFIEPPATGHHQWSGAKRFSKIIFTILFTIHGLDETTFLIKMAAQGEITNIQNVLATQRKEYRMIKEKILSGYRQKQRPAQFPRLHAAAPRLSEPRPPRPPSKLPRFEPCGKGFQCRNPVSLLL